MKKPVNREKIRERWRRWRRTHLEHAKALSRASSNRSHAKHRLKHNAWRNERKARNAWRVSTSSEILSMGCGIYSAHEMKRPPLRFIDASGRVRSEDYRSAEELIRDWELANRKGSRDEE